MHGGGWHVFESMSAFRVCMQQRRRRRRRRKERKKEECLHDGALFLFAITRCFISPQQAHNVCKRIPNVHIVLQCTTQRQHSIGRREGEEGQEGGGHTGQCVVKTTAGWSPSAFKQGQHQHQTFADVSRYLNPRSCASASGSLALTFLLSFKS